MQSDRDQNSALKWYVMAKGYPLVPICRRACRTEVSCGGPFTNLSDTIGVYKGYVGIIEGLTISPGGFVKVI